MANRLTRIYTRTGDTGETGTADGARIAKDDLLMHVQGDIDELNSLLGVLATRLTGDLLDLVRDVQHALFDIGGEISLGEHLLDEKHVPGLEARIDELNAKLEPLKEFILPGGNEAGALTHLARTVCRRVERNMVSLDRVRSINPASMAYMNRLSDLLFVLARTLNDKDEIYWRSQKLGKGS